MNDKWDNGKPKMGNQKSRGTVPSDTITQFGEIARDALLAESASGGLSRMQLFNLSPMVD